MHRALRVPELLRLICLDIGGGNKFFPSGLQELAMLARTCTTISEHALDVLWADSPTILDLMECMPPDLWKKDGVSSNKISVTPPLKNESVCPTPHPPK